MKAFRLLPLHTGDAARQSNRRAHAPAPSEGEARLPHRRLALHALRQLARGHYLVVGGDTSLAVRLPGVPDAVHLADDFIARRLVYRVDAPDCPAACYALSDAGRETLQRGERWWSELTLLERAVVHVTG